MNRFVKLRGPYSFVFICYRDLEPVKSLRQQFMTFQQGNLILHGICNCENCPNQLMDMNRVVYPVPFVSPDERVLIQAAVWSPRSNALVYCRQNDIYYIPDVTIDQTERLTSDGSFNAISNGIPDWTYRGKSNKLEPKCAYEVITFFFWVSRTVSFHLARNVQPTSTLVLGNWGSIVVHYVQRYRCARTQTSNL